MAATPSLPSSRVSGCRGNPQILEGGGPAPPILSGPSGRGSVRAPSPGGQPVSRPGSSSTFLAASSCGAADLIGKLRFEQVVVEADDDQLVLGLFGHGALSRAGDGAAADDGLPLLGLLDSCRCFGNPRTAGQATRSYARGGYGSCPVLPFWSRLVAAGTAAASTVDLVPGAVASAWFSRGTGRGKGVGFGAGTGAAGPAPMTSLPGGTLACGFWVCDFAVLRICRITAGSAPDPGAASPGQCVPGRSAASPIHSEAGCRCRHGGCRWPLPLLVHGRTGLPHSPRCLPPAGGGCGRPTMSVMNRPAGLARDGFAAFRATPVLR